MGGLSWSSSKIGQVWASEYNTITFDFYVALSVENPSLGSVDAIELDDSVTWKRNPAFTPPHEAFAIPVLPHVTFDPRSRLGARHHWHRDDGIPVAVLRLFREGSGDGMPATNGPRGGGGSRGDPSKRAEAFVGPQELVHHALHSADGTADFHVHCENIPFEY